MTDDASSIEPWLNTLRGDVQPMSAEARERLGLRLASATVLVAAGAAAPALSSALHRGFWYSRAFTAALTLPLGVLVGAAGHAYLVPATIQVVSSVPAVSPPVSPPVSLTAAPAPSAAAESDPVVPSLPRPSAPPTPSAKSDAAVPSIERELSLLERARSKLSEGEPQATLQLLGEHQGRYPASALQQEREALAIRALLAAGRRADAQRRAQAFIRAYPTSALRSSLERIAGTIP